MLEDMPTNLFGVKLEWYPSDDFSNIFFAEWEGGSISYDSLSGDCAVMIQDADMSFTDRQPDDLIPLRFIVPIFGSAVDTTAFNEMVLATTRRPKVEGFDPELFREPLNVSFTAPIFAINRRVRTDWDLKGDKLVMPWNGGYLQYDKQKPLEVVYVPNQDVDPTTPFDRPLDKQLSFTYNIVDGNVMIPITLEDLKGMAVVKPQPAQEGYYYRESECGACGAPMSVRQIDKAEWDNASHRGRSFQNYTDDELLSAYGIEKDEVLGVVYDYTRRCSQCREY